MRINDLFTRAIRPTLGNVIEPSKAVRKGVQAATHGVSWLTPGQPMMPTWDVDAALRYYAESFLVMRCYRTIADSLAMLPGRVGPDPDTPSYYVSDHPMAKLLSTASAKAPGGPNPRTSARALWNWSTVQYLITGKMAWEIQVDYPKGPPVGLWPLVSAALDPIPSPPGEQRWWEAFQYRTPQGVIRMPEEKVFYAWRPAADDYRQPESDLVGARYTAELHISLQKYMFNLLRSGLMASSLVVTPPFARENEARAFEESFLQEFTGVDRSGSTIFAEFEPSADDKGNLQQSVRVEKLSVNPVDAQLLDWYEQVCIDLTMALGVPYSLIGNASQRTYSNASQEETIFWSNRMLPLLGDLQDAVNQRLSPRFGEDMFWFDVTEVAALQPNPTFAPPAVKDLIEQGIITPEQVIEVLRIPPSSQTHGESPETAPIGAIAPGSSGAMGNRSNRRSLDLLGEGPSLEHIINAMQAEGFGWDSQHRAWMLPREAPSQRQRRVNRLRRSLNHGVPRPLEEPLGRQRT